VGYHLEMITCELMAHYLYLWKMEGNTT